MKKENGAYIIMILVNIIWGFGFIASDWALTHNWPVFTILFYRNIVGFICFFWLALKEKFWKDKFGIIVGLLGGILYFFGYVFQLYGQNLTSTTNTGLITALGVVMGPMFYWIFFKKRPDWYAFVACGLGLIGAFILSYNPGFSFKIGDILVFIASMIFAIHVAYIGKNGDDVGIGTLLSSQFLLIAMLSMVGMIVTKSPIVGDKVGWSGVIYYSFVSGALGLLGQFYSQRILESYKISLLLVLEGLFAAIFSILILKEPLTLKVIIGGLTMLGSILFMNIMDMKKRRLSILENNI